VCFIAFFARAATSQYLLAKALYNVIAIQCEHGVPGTRSGLKYLGAFPTVGSAPPALTNDQNEAIIGPNDAG